MTRTAEQHLAYEPMALTADGPNSRDQKHLPLVADVRYPQRGNDGAQLAHASSYAVVGGSDVCGEDLSSHQPCGCIWAKLVEERGDVVQSLEGLMKYG